MTDDKKRKYFTICVNLLLYSILNILISYILLILHASGMRDIMYVDLDISYKFSLMKKTENMAYVKDISNEGL